MGKLLQKLSYKNIFDFVFESKIWGTDIIPDSGLVYFSLYAFQISFGLKSVC